VGPLTSGRTAATLLRARQLGRDFRHVPFSVYAVAELVRELVEQQLKLGPMGLEQVLPRRIFM